MFFFAPLTCITRCSMWIESASFPLKWRQEATQLLICRTCCWSDAIKHSSTWLIQYFHQANGRGEKGLLFYAGIIILCYFRLHPVRAIPLKKLHKKCPRYVDNVFSSGTYLCSKKHYNPVFHFWFLSSSFGEKSDQSWDTRGQSPWYLGFHGNCGLFVKT